MSQALPTSTTNLGAVSVLGLGLMGRALAETLIASGATVTVWNRTPRPEVAVGAAVADDPSSAIAASPVTIVCISDQDAVRSILAGPGVESALNSRTLINLTTGTPVDAEELASTVNAVGGQYLAGTIFAYPEGIGQEESRLILSGPAAIWQAHADLLRRLGGGSWYAGEQVGAAAALDVTVALGFYHVALNAFLEAAAGAYATGVTTQALLRATQDAIDILKESVQLAADQIEQGVFETDQATVDVHLAAVQLAEQVIAPLSNGRHPLVSTTVEDLAAASAAGHGNHSFASVYPTRFPITRTKEWG